MVGSLFDLPEWITKRGWLRPEAGSKVPKGSLAGSEDEWQLTLKLTSGKMNNMPGEPAVELNVESPAWRDAAEAVRTTVKWLIAAFAVVGALMFAKGFVTTPRLSWNENGPQLVWAGILGIVGLVGIGVVLYVAVSMLRPAVYDINDLPPEFIALVDNPANRYLPTRIENFEEFKDAFRITRHSVISATENRDTARKLLKSAEESNPPDPGAVNKAKEKLEREQEVLAKVLRSFDSLKRVRVNLLNKAEYWKESTAFDRRRGTLILAAIGAALGGIGYQLALATPEQPAGTVPSSTAAPSIGELIRSDSAAGRELWEQLGLSRCQAVEGAARIAVVVSSGNGSAQNPHVVSTVPTNTCPGQMFAVIDEVARVSLPVKRDIVYTPTPSQSTAGIPR